MNPEPRTVFLPGALSLVPFGALPQPGAGPNLSPLIAAHEIVQVPSATILGAMRQLTSGRARPTRTAAIFADPIFDVQDPRVRVKPASVRVRRDAVLNRERSRAARRRRSARWRPGA